jgi:CO dehydrogenase nickel-insertion accessory protein CooC1
MPVVGFNLEKISIEKQNPITGQVKVKNNVSVKSVEEKELSLGNTNKQGLKFNFEFSIDYDPKVGNMSLKGHLLYIEDEKKVKDILKDWKKDKKISNEIMVELINTILLRCTVKTLTFAQEVNLPPHLPLPRVNQKTDTSNYIG